jgi:hypothetical protein
MNILALAFVSLFIMIVILTRDYIFGGKANIPRLLMKEIAAKRGQILKDKLFISVLISILIFFTARTTLFDKIEIFKSIGLSPDKKMVVTEKRMNVIDQSGHFLFGTIIGYAFDSWAAAFGIGCMKEISDFADHYYHHSISGPQIIHDGIVDPLFWMLGGLVGNFSLASVHLPT